MPVSRSTSHVGCIAVCFDKSENRDGFESVNIVMDSLGSIRGIILNSRQSKPCVSASNKGVGNNGSKDTRSPILNASVKISQDLGVDGRRFGG